ncbi:hypothetical protein IscW_ISCW022768 [Ixodes scapularis]|uniref:Uncharacterized protein n=1 Tax=Ixodes scapularis TaxID=6945 RepID=B7QC87_IXOSC|nr:hypothetical protein IscW_ISCW022768 [Ixodes scapularis]|eukprot:XP_002413151.1 hypothetical protein IscW_ISCW022768 [Ixodes scapularis]
MNSVGYRVFTLKISPKCLIAFAINNTTKSSKIWHLVSSLGVWRRTAHICGKKNHWQNFFSRTHSWKCRQRCKCHCCGGILNRGYSSSRRLASCSDSQRKSRLPHPSLLVRHWLESGQRQHDTNLVV